MNGSRTMVRLALGGVLVAATGSVLAAQEAKATDKPSAEEAANPIGRWNLTVDGRQPSWLGIRRGGQKHLARFLGGAGSVKDMGEVKVDGNKIEFNAHGWKWTGTIKGDTITGTRVHNEDKNNKGKWAGQRSVRKVDLTGKWCLTPSGGPVEHPAVLELKQQGDTVTGKMTDAGKTADITDGKITNRIFVSFTAAFPDGQRKYTASIKGDVLDGWVAEGRRQRLMIAYRQRQWGNPVELFNGMDLSNWKPLGSKDNFQWKVIFGIMTNTGGGGSANIVSKETFRDLRAHVEFRVPERGNSGLYLRGRHEIQISDSAGHDPNWHICGALYSRLAPNVNAARKHGEWQTLDVTLVGNYLTVVHNGQVIIDNEEVVGITGGAIDSKEGDPGPIYLQGDHGRIEYRRITIWPAK